jgi:hypothetical protein
VAAEQRASIAGDGDATGDIGDELRAAVAQ